MSSPAMKYFPKAQTEFSTTIPMIANGNAFLGDISTSLDKEKPISAGFYRLEPGPALDYTYTYDEMKIIVSGSFDITDESGTTAHAVPGDVFYFPKGAKIHFETTEGGLAFFTGQRAEGGA
ncbi:hypothetical protein P152DRAFT_461799 [Eremomyces bilateralis CBS 781.70]|uniref:Ethanolamine utilization protein n=1 Tax=Eremomyces bilateralis CBS 781.70 TaxID=1392243 RepID=A0A6G1FTM9_9PEZI|nr:uncharacterized protein P152DRAFT_461799 [Eremomyces bilateralis CBS 781.70]KAF1809157.1 hypothetical protein P152DRAFT_461799 [Eremomyces bilateralis CBS 781.70]